MPDVPPGAARPPRRGRHTPACSCRSGTCRGWATLRCCAFARTRSSRFGSSDLSSHPPLLLSDQLRLFETGVGIHRVVHRLLRTQERVNGAQIVAFELRKIQPWHEGKVLRADFRRAFFGIFAIALELVDEVLLRPATDTGLRVGRDIGADYHHAG